MNRAIVFFLLLRDYKLLCTKPKRLSSHVYSRAADHDRQARRDGVDNEDELKWLLEKLEALQATTVNLQTTKKK